MELEDIDEIIKEWSKEWKISVVDLSNLDEELSKEKDKGKEEKRRRSARERSIRLRKKANCCIKGQSQNHTNLL